MTTSLLQSRNLGWSFPTTYGMVWKMTWGRALIDGCVDDNMVSWQWHLSSMFTLRSVPGYDVSSIPVQCCSEFCFHAANTPPLGMAAAHSASLMLSIL